ncbi:hypothetical protein M8494_05650 [Serratia ureilytica]
MFINPRCLHADVTLAEALSWPLVLSPRGTVPRQNAEALIVSHGLAVPEGCVETLSVTLARCLTLQYGYVWLVPYGAVRDDLFGNHLRALPLPTREWQNRWASLPGKRRSRP